MRHSELDAVRPDVGLTGQRSQVCEYERSCYNRTIYRTLCHPFRPPRIPLITLTANDLKTKGVSDLERILQDAQEAVISVRGKPRYVVMDIAHYEYLRECEIAAAWVQARADRAAGRYRQESADAHMARLETEMNDAP